MFLHHDNANYIILLAMCGLHKLETLKYKGEELSQHFLLDFFDFAGQMLKHLGPLINTEVSR